jgi:ORF6N domain
LRPQARVRSEALGSLRRIVDRSKAVTLQLVPAPAIQKRILVVRERQVMLDEDLADLYGVETKRLIEQVKRNIERFPADFMFQLSQDEAEALRSQTATSSRGHGGRRYAPYVFTEQGVAMLSGVLRSERAVAVNIAIMRAFVELRRAAASYSAIKKRLEALERARPRTRPSSRASAPGNLIARSGRGSSRHASPFPSCSPASGCTAIRQAAD